RVAAPLGGAVARVRAGEGCSGGPLPGIGEPKRGLDGPNRPKGRMLVFDHGVTSGRLGIAEGARDVVDGSAGDIACAHELDPLGDGSPCERLLKKGEEDVPVAVAGGEVGEPLVVCERRLAERVAQTAPERLLWAGHDEPS